jgi:multidrug efflux pump subunit AcrA (membrane-fusion protein)
MLDRITPNDRAVMGGNRPPSALELAKPTIEELGTFLKDFPVVTNDAEAREAKVILDRTVLAFKGIEDERKAKVAPLNAELAAINGEYHRWHNAGGKPGTWDTLLKELRIRLTKFAQAEEAKRQTAAEAARAAAAEAERKAREAEQREREAAAEAAQGVCDVDFAAVTQEADQAFAQFQRADRIAQRAERDMTVRIGGGFGRVSTLRTVEALIITDAHALLEDVGVTEDVAAALIKAARAYRKENHELPRGIAIEVDRRI